MHLEETIINKDMTERNKLTILLWRKFILEDLSNIKSSDNYCGNGFSFKESMNLVYQFCKNEVLITGL